MDAQESTPSLSRLSAVLNETSHAPTRPRFFNGQSSAGGGDAATGRAGMAYQETFNQWQAQIDAINNDLSLSPEQRAAAIVGLRARQQAAAKGAAARVTAEEKQNAQAFRRYKQQLAAQLAPR
jgi:hypothetical protein